MIEKRIHKWFKVGTTVFFTAYLPDDPLKKLYVCSGEITRLPNEETSNYRMIVTGVADRSMNGIKDTVQKNLIGRAIKKRHRELYWSLGPIMEPKRWIVDKNG